MVSEELMTQMANKIVRADVAQRVARAPAQQRVDDAVRVRAQHAGDVLTTPALLPRCIVSSRHGAASVGILNAGRAMDNNTLLYGGWRLLLNTFP